MKQKLSPKQEDKVRGIPGLSIYGGYARGEPDAIAAARVRLGGVPRKHWNSHPAVTDSEDLTGLRDYQKRGVYFLQERLLRFGGAILSDDMGLGKTLQSLKAIDASEARRVLVVCPAAARETWRDELEKWGFPDHAILEPGVTKKVLAAWEKAKTARVVVCSYHHETIARVSNEVFAAEYPDAIVLDEAHRIRGPVYRSKRSKELQELCDLAKYKLAITGTPHYDRTRDWYQLLRCVLGQRFGRNQWVFDVAYCGGHKNEWNGWENKGATNTEEFKLRLSLYMLRREKKNVAKELPPLIRQVRWVDADQKAKLEFERLQAGFGKGQMHVAIEATLKGKMPEALDLAEEAKQFLLVTWLRSHAHQMQQELLKRDVPCVLVTGDISTQRRALLLREAQAKKWGVVATLDSVSESLNLQGIASIGIAHHIDPVPNKMAQMEGRLHRLGQDVRVLWYYLAMKNSVDTRIVPHVIKKLDAIRAVMGTGKEMRDALGDYVDGAGAVAHEKQMMEELYAAMKEGQHGDTED